MDIKLAGRTADVRVNDRNDLAVVSGIEAEVQSIRNAVRRFFNQEIGSVDQQNAAENVEIYCRRVAQENPNIEEVESVTVAIEDGTMEVTITFGVTEAFFEVN